MNAPATKTVPLHWLRLGDRQGALRVLGTLFLLNWSSDFEIQERAQRPNVLSDRLWGRLVEPSPLARCDVSFKRIPDVSAGLAFLRVDQHKVEGLIFTGWQLADNFVGVIIH